MSVYNIRYIKFFLSKLDWTADNRPWLRLRKWYPVKSDSPPLITPLYKIMLNYTLVDFRAQETKL